MRLSEKGRHNFLADKVRIIKPPENDSFPKMTSTKYEFSLCEHHSPFQFILMIIKEDKRPTKI